MPTRAFTPATLAFLRDLSRHNDRAWFRANQERYERDVREPALGFVAGVAPRLGRVAPHLVADPRPAGGSLFRIHRDVRFAKDKSPYKTHVGIHFFHEAGKDVTSPSLYLHIEPGGSFVGCGVYHPQAEALRRIRSAIAREPRRWKRAVKARAFASAYALAGDRLQRPPRGFDAGHECIEDLMRKDFTGVAPLGDAAVTAPDLLQQFLARARAAASLQRFLAAALDLPY